MTNETVQALIVNSFSDFGLSMLVVLASLSLLLVSFFVFKFGINKLLYDKSLMICGFYLRSTPYKGYNRFRTQSWNSKHTM